MPVLNKETILAAKDLVTQTLKVAEWGGDVIIRVMTAAERDNWDASLFTIDGKERKANCQNVRARLLAMTLIGEDGERLFNENDIESLGKKSSKVLDKLFNIACEINGLADNEVKALEKN